MNDNQKATGAALVVLPILAIAGLTLLIAFIFGVAVAKKHYSVWAMEMQGEGILRQANMERQALVAQAQAERDSASLRAEAISIIGGAAQQYPEYRTQEFIGAFARCLETGCASQIIYVPTEANIPITEAGKRR